MTSIYKQLFYYYNIILLYSRSTQSSSMGNFSHSTSWETIYTLYCKCI